MEFVSQLVENYGNIVVFIILSCGLFSFPISDELLVLLLGYFTKNDALHYYPTLFVIFSGSVIGMLVNYLIGKKIGRPFLNLFGKWFKRSLKTSYKAEKWIQKYGFSAIIISYFVPGMRHITGYFCGMAHMALKSYVIYVVLSAFLWSWLFLTLSQFFKI